MRYGTPNLNLGMYDEEDIPGAGERTVASPGINGDRMKLDQAIGVGHNADGSHKTNTIDGPQLKTTAADQSTLELAGSPLKLQLKDGGITAAKLAADAVTAEKLNADTAGAGLTQDAGGALQVNVDNTTLQIASDVVKVKDGGIGTTQMAAGAITSEKFSTSGVTKAKQYFEFRFASATSQGSIGGITPVNYASGFRPPRAGKVTGIVIYNSAWVRYESWSSSVAFTASDVMVPEVNSTTFILYKNGSNSWQLSFAGTPVFVLIEFEND